MKTKSIIGIVKVVKPNNNPVIGIADGKGKFCWLNLEHILDTFPQGNYGGRLFEQYQETAFELTDDAKVKITPEKNYEKYSYVYKNTVYIPEPVPDKFKRNLIKWEDGNTTAPAGKSTTYTEERRPEPRHDDNKGKDALEILNMILKEVTKIKELLAHMQAPSIPKKPTKKIVVREEREDGLPDIFG